MKKVLIILGILLVVGVLVFSYVNVKKNAAKSAKKTQTNLVATSTNSLPTATSTKDSDAETMINYESLSPSEYKDLIDLKAAEAARLRLFATSTSDLGTQIDADNEIKDIKNNCNLEIDPAATLSADIIKKIKQGFICRYVKGSVSNNSRVDEFTIKFIGTVPFEFGIDNNLTFNTSFGSLILNKQVNPSLVETQAKITTVMGKINFNNSVAGNVSVGSGAVNTKTTTGTITSVNQIAEANSNATVYMVVLGDDGKQGKAVGCGDSLVPVKVHVNFTNTKTDQKIRDTLQKLFSFRSKVYSKDLNLINPLYNSVLSVSEVTISGSQATVALDGTLNLDGACDDPVVEAQIKNLILQFKPITSVVLRINTPGEDDVF